MNEVSVDLFSFISRAYSKHLLIIHTWRSRECEPI